MASARIRPVDPKTSQGSHACHRRASNPLSAREPATPPSQTNVPAATRNRSLNRVDIEGLKALPRPLSEPVPTVGFSLDALAKDIDSKDFVHDTRNEQSSVVPEWRRSGSGSTVGEFDSPLVTGFDKDDKTVISTTDADAYLENAKPEKSETSIGRSNETAVDTPSVFVRLLAEIGLLPHDPTVFVGKRIRNATVRAHLGHTFIPNKQVEKLVTQDAVQFELSKANRSMTKISRLMKPPIVAEERGSYRKILAILHLMKRPSKVRLFVKYGVCDSDLPLEEVPCLTGPRSFCELRSPKSGSSVRFPKRADAREFLDRQWSVLVPFFHGSDGRHIPPHRDLGSEDILPFLSHEEAAKEGGSGKVFKVEIHPDHHSFQKSDCNIYAVKALKSPDERAFRQEAKVLQKLSHERHVHPHLITLLATYKHSGTYHLIFPWAETDLFGYWKRFPDPSKDEATGTWLIEQCRGLAEGLYTIHRYETLSGTSLLNVFGLGTGQKSQESLRIVRRESANISHTKSFYGRHGDLKPENILWFPDPSFKSKGILKITDFGIARFNKENIWEHRQSGRAPNSPTYRSPEIDLEEKLSTACDVWALGCVYLLFITWYFGGESYLKHFGNKRKAVDHNWWGITTDTFFTIYEEYGVKKAKVKDAVLQMIEELHEHQRCTEDFRNFLEIIRSDMLVIHQPDPPDQEEVASLIPLGSIPRSLNVPGQYSPRRKSCGDIHRLLGDIKPRCDQESICTRRSTMEPPSPLAQLHFNWIEPECSASPTLLYRAPPGRRKSSGPGLRKQAALANRSSLPEGPITHADDPKGSHQEHATHSYGMVQVPP